MLDYFLFSQDLTLSNAGVSFNVQPSTVKLSLSLLGWKFQQRSANLTVHLFIDVIPTVTSFARQDTTELTTFTLQSGDVSTTTLTLLRFGIADNTTIAPVDFSLNLLNTTSDSSNYELVLSLPHFQTSFVYDPDFSVTLVGSGGDGGSGGGSLLPLIALSALAIPILCVVAGIILFTFLYIRKHKMTTNIANALQKNTSNDV